MRLCKSSGMPNADERLIGVPESATILGISQATVTRWAQNGKLPYLRKLPGKTGPFLFDAAVVRRVAQDRLLQRAG